ncbi:hypothetical protein [Ochrobactrum sp. MYb379]|uniref:hypothetical protein n=1 Tax=Ochrobactrum sp. MYb379 TaxID=2745275 RepID=UPI0030ACDD49
MSSNISIITTTGALATGNEDDDLVYQNEVNVYGKPGASIICDVSYYASIYQNGFYQPSPYNTVLKLDEKTGLASSRFQVRFKPPKQASQTMQLTTVEVSAYDMSDPEDIATQSPSFESGIHISDVQYIDGYNLIYGAPADDYTPCAVTIFVSDDAPNDSIQTICMSIDPESAASIVGADPNSGDKRKTVTLTKSEIRFELLSKVPGQNVARVFFPNSTNGDALIFGKGPIPPITFSHLPQKV